MLTKLKCMYEATAKVSAPVSSSSISRATSIAKRFGAAHPCKTFSVMQIDYGITTFLNDDRGSADKLVVVLDCRETTAFKVVL